MLQSPQREELAVDGWDSRTSDVNRTFPVYNRSQRCLFKHEHDRSLTYTSWIATIKVSSSNLTKH